MKNIMIICVLTALPAYSTSAQLDKADDWLSNQQLANDALLSCTQHMHFFMQNHSQICNVENEIIARMIFLSKECQPVYLSKKLREQAKAYIDFRKRVRRNAESVQYCLKTNPFRAQRAKHFASVAMIVRTWVLAKESPYTTQSSDAACRYDDCQSVRVVLDDFCQDCRKISDFYEQQKTHIDHLCALFDRFEHSDALILTRDDKIQTMYNLRLYDECCKIEKDNMEEWIQKFEHLLKLEEDLSDDVEAVVLKQKNEEERVAARVRSANHLPCIIL
ncbi:MAG: hypothetical protein OXC30_01205 [Alphaproteobacteria bacterium]|nr:hypothetical protein [Alphaproteobacteria bacterium]